MITQIYNNLIWFSYNGDEVAWNGHKYLSLCSLGEFNSLSDLDDFWNSYNEAQEKFYKEQYESIAKR